MAGIEKKPLIVITGPTASGKTNLSIELASKLDIQIISADSRQVFKYLDIGTAKPTKEELSAVKHHFIDIVDPDEYYSAGKYGEEAYNTVVNVYSKGKIPIVVGGSGLYIQALCEGFFEEGLNKGNTEIRGSLEKELNDKGADALYDALLEKDNESALKYSDKNPRRIIRALEYYYSTGEKLSDAHKRKNSERKITPYYFSLNYDRNELYERINLRTELMWKQGIVEETEKVLNMGYSPNLNALNTVGYKECISFLYGKMSQKQAIEEIKKNTRRYAKRQLTWFRRYPEMNLLSPQKNEFSEQVLKILNS